MEINSEIWLPGFFIIVLLISFIRTFNNETMIKQFENYKQKYDHHILLYIFKKETNYLNYVALKRILYLAGMIVFTLILYAELIYKTN